MSINDIETFYPKSKKEWRKWLEKNHVIKDSIWVLCYRKSANKPTVSWSDSVDEALCFGWIDSVKRKLDDERSIQFFSKRKPKSTWSKINKIKVQGLIEAGLMTEAGMKCIEIAKQNGWWNILDEVEELIVHKDLEAAFKLNTAAEEYYISLSKSNKKIILQYLVMAMREETRQKRIVELVGLFEKGLKPKFMP